MHEECKTCSNYADCNISTDKVSYKLCKAAILSKEKDYEHTYKHLECIKKGVPDHEEDGL